MERVVGDFVGILRRHQVRVSPAEGIDALKALTHVGLAERPVVRDTLRATLVKNADDAETFDRLFDVYFGLGEPPPEPTARMRPHTHDDDHAGTPNELRFEEELEREALDDQGSHGHDKEPSVDLRKVLDEDQIAPSSDIHGDPERLRLSVFGRQLMLSKKQDALEAALERMTHQLRVRRARSFSPGAIAPETGATELPIDLAAADLDELADALVDLEVDPELISALTAQADDILAGLPELIAAMLERQRRLSEAGGTPDLGVTDRHLRKLLDVSPAEQRELERALRRLGRELHGARSRRMRPDRTGRISVSRTLRRSLGHEGIPFTPVLRRHRESRPRLVVLCDVSLSTRNLARFWLQLVYGMQGLFSKVRTFVFVSDLAEVTGLFEEQPLGGAVASIFGGGLIDVDANSDFGRAAEAFRLEYLQAVTRRTTVVVLGDGRNNGRPANAAALEEIARHARRVVWMTPEPRWSWTLGGCDMKAYAPLCDRVEVVRTPEELSGVAESLALETVGRREK